MLRTKTQLMIAACLGLAASMGMPGLRMPSLQYRSPRSRWTDGKDRERIAAAEAKRERKAAKLRSQR